MANKPKHELWVKFNSRVPYHTLKVLKEHCRVSGMKMQNFIAVAIVEKLERTKPKTK